MNDNDDSGANGGASEKTENGTLADSLVRWWKRRRRGRANGDALREAIDGLIESDEVAEVPLEMQERILLENIIHLRDRTILDVLVPRADIVAVEASTPFPEVVELLMREGHSRLPVYRETLDNPIGMVHIKDLLAQIDHQADVDLAAIVRDILFVPPSMRVLELLLEMRVKRCHLALVVDEFGGIDGLVSIEDLVEEIVGEIEDEHDQDDTPDLVKESDSVFLADARLDIEEFLNETGFSLDAKDHSDIDTLGGLVFALAGRIPSRGELVCHPGGLEFEILDADPRRIRRLRIRRLATNNEPES